MTLVPRREIARMLRESEEAKLERVVRMMGGRRNFTGDQEAIEHMRATIRRLSKELAELKAARKGKK